VKSKISDVKKRYETEKEFTESLLQQGLSEGDIESRIREQMMMYALIDKEIRSRIQITPGEITAYYGEHKQELALPEQRTLVSIAAANEDEARDLCRQLRRGKDIEELAAAKNIKTSAVSARRGELKKEIDDAVFALADGGVTDPLSVNGTFYVFKLKEILPPKTPTLTEAQDQLSELLFQKKMQEDVAAWLETVKKKSYIRVME
jgi:parvulin-like peptidyl-prolyl isomerase